MIKFAIGLFVGIVICHVSWVQFVIAAKYIVDNLGKVLS